MHTGILRTVPSEKHGSRKRDYDAEQKLNTKQRCPGRTFGPRKIAPKAGQRGNFPWGAGSPAEDWG